MRISKKYNCSGCRALTKEHTCLLGYRMKSYEKMFLPHETWIVPFEKCPKPTTKDDFRVAKLTMMKKGDENDADK